VAFRDIVLVDKPKGPTSHDVVQMVKRAVGAKKAGHTGTLDPNATGLLVIGLDEATKAMPAFVGLHKEYVAVVHLHGEVAHGAAADAATGFVGEIIQLPPVRSRVKRQLRKRRVFEFEVLGQNGRDVAIRVLCEAGTYIRTLACDLGDTLGCGAHLVEIRRTRVGPFTSALAQAPAELAGDDARIYPLEAALTAVGVKLFEIDDDCESRVRNGLPITITPPATEPVWAGNAGLVGVCDASGCLIALGAVEAHNGGLSFKSRRGFARQDPDPTPKAP